MEKEALSRKTKKNPSKPKLHGLKPKSVTWKKKPQVEKQKHLSKPNPDGLKPKAVT